MAPSRMHLPMLTLTSIAR